MISTEDKLILALPKGRVFEECLPLIQDSKFQLLDDPSATRKILLDTATPEVKVLLIRGWDVPTYVTFGAAHVGIVGKDILLEKSSEEFIELEDLHIGKCRISLAGKKEIIEGRTRLKVATKYPNTAKRFLESLAIQAEIVYLHGSQEIAPLMGLCEAIIDLVDSGKTLKENGLEEIKVIREISSRMIVNKAALKTKNVLIKEIRSTLIS
ncbi:MAG TPA: ATP phosphoribosyltransferase [Gammaproteobacteria bacterium]|nr:ATP phosphoribosyltransferase [Gammaproteobacteria bacterium]